MLVIVVVDGSLFVAYVIQFGDSPAAAAAFV